MTLGVALTWHIHAWEELLSLVRLCESLGYRAVYVDGDVSMLVRRREAEVLDGWSATIALLARTERIALGSIRLVHHWNAARLAQAAATAERIAPGRLRFLISIGGQREDARFGFADLVAGERIRWLDETLTVVRALWRGEEVSYAGRYVRVERARVRPSPAGGSIPIEIAGRGRRLLDLVATHADVWDVNLPPVRKLVAEAEEDLGAACRRVDRDPADLRRSMWIFTRVGDFPHPKLTAEFRKFNPWFGWLPDTDLDEAIVTGTPEQCRSRLGQIRRELHVDLPVLDLSGLDAERARRALVALAPPKNHVDSGSSSS